MHKYSNVSTLPVKKDMIGEFFKKVLYLYIFVRNVILNVKKKKELKNQQIDLSVLMIK